ncbi:ABC transporter substrate-binding protein [Kineococcus arenarius]|uniref:ABC transporter substrate-binding protein n=1 Tax=unclassified Kineococcus TaxID=2621656 RepID=UPI003D7EDD9D
MTTPPRTSTPAAASPRAGRHLGRRSFGLSALGAAALAGCGRFSSDSGGSGVELSFAWWGDASRAEATEAAVATFVEKNPGITVRTEYQDSSPYQDKLATRVAAGDAPDVMAMPNRALREYAGRGALADLGSVGVDLSAVEDRVIGLGTVDDTVYGIAAGLNTVGVVFRKQHVLDAGLPLPDGDTWSWEDYEGISRAITENTGRAVYGSGYSMEAETGNIIFTRQQGQDFYTADGTLGADASSIAAWYAMNVRFRDSGALPPAGYVDVTGSSAEQSFLAQDKVASQFIPTNNLGAYNRACGGDLVLLRMPGETTGVRRGMSVDCSMLWSVSAQSKHPAEAAALLDFLVNDPDAYTEMMTTRGVPPNPDVTEAIKKQMSPDDLAATEFLLALQEEDLPPTYVYPRGATAMASEISTVATEIEFGRMTPEQAADALLRVGQSELSA